MKMPTLLTEKHGMVFALHFDGQGSAQELSWEHFTEQWKAPGLVWLHGDYRGEDTERWLREASGMVDSQVDYLLAERTRPGLIASGESVMLILRALNPHEEKPLEDLVSLRLWVDADHLLTFRLKPVQVFQEMREALRNGEGPQDAAGFVAELLERVVSDLHTCVLEMFESVTELEEEALTSASSREMQARLRLKALQLRRHLMPQLNVMEQLELLRFKWLSEEHRLGIRSAHERLKRVLDDIELMLERLRLLREEEERQLNERINARLYVLAILSGIFLPLNLLASLLGMNVGGIPLSHSVWGFSGICAIMALAGCVVLLFLRIKRLI